MEPDVEEEEEKVKVYVNVEWIGEKGVFRIGSE